MRKQQEPVVIIGGGLAGLATLALLSRAGRPARLIEAARELGGRSRVTLHGEAVLGLGAHALYKSHTAKLFRELGIELSGREVQHRNARGLLDDGELALPLSVWSLLTSGDIALGDKLKMGAVLGPLGLFAPARADQTVEEWIDANDLAPKTRLLVTALARVTNYSSLHELSAEVAKEQLAIGSKGVRYLDGGFAQLVTKLAAYATAAGGQIETERAARGVEVEGGRAVGVRLASGEILQASHVVLCVSPQQLAKLLPQSQEAAVHKEQAIPMRAACLDLVVDGPVPDSTFALGLNQPQYFAVHSEAAKLCPSGQTVLHTARYLAPREHLPADAVRSELEQLVERAAPGAIQRVVAAQFLPSIAVAEWLPTAASGGYAGRPDIKVDVAGVYRAGDWVGRAGMLSDAACASARAVCEAILRDAVVERAA